MSGDVEGSICVLCGFSVVLLGLWKFVEIIAWVAAWIGRAI